MNPPICSICAKRGAPGYFKVGRVDPNGVESPLTTTCSIKCLLQWGYSYAALQGARAVWTAKQAIKMFFDPKG